MIIDLNINKEKLEASEKEKKRLTEENKQYKMNLDNLQTTVNEQSSVDRQTQNQSLSGDRLSNSQTSPKIVIFILLQLINLM